MVRLKSSGTQTNDYCYIDLRDVRYGRTEHEQDAYNEDIRINYVGGTRPFVWDAEGTEFEDEVIQNHHIYIWRGDHDPYDGDDEPDYTLPDVSLFPTDYWEKSFCLDYHITDSETTLSTFWGRYPGNNVNTYELSRATSSTGRTFSDDDFTSIYTTADNTIFHYKDNSIDPNNNPIVAYKLKANLNDGTTTKTKPNVYYIWTEEFSWQSSLVLVEQEHPNLFWSKVENTNANWEYEIYRGTKDPNNPKPYFEYELIGSVNQYDYVLLRSENGSTEFKRYSFIDSGALINNNAPELKYYVKAFKSGSSNGITNKVSTNATYTIEKEITESSESIADMDIRLDVNYPNPFNPTTTITYTLPEELNVKLRAYDPFGREVAELVNQIKSKGRHSVNFNGSDLASGVYYYTLSVGNYKETKKLMLVK